MAVIDNGSLTNAAAELNVSQPAVSRLLADLNNLGFFFVLTVKTDGWYLLRKLFFYSQIFDVYLN